MFLLMHCCCIQDDVFCDKPVLQVSFNEARSDDKYQHQYVNTCKYLVDRGWFLHAIRKKSCKKNTVDKVKAFAIDGKYRIINYIVYD